MACAHRIPTVARCFGSTLLLLATLPLPIRAGDDDVAVDLEPWPAPTITEFDPNNPPKDLNSGEDADAAGSVGFDAPGFGTFWDPATKVLCVTSVDKINVEGRTDIRLPNNANQMLKDHENGHDTLNKNEYENKVKQKIQDAFRGFKGMKFEGVGADDAARKADAEAKADAERDRRAARAEAAIAQQFDTLGKKYDKLTDHGRGKATDTKSGKPLDTTTGVAEAIAERDKAPKAGAQGALPNSSKPFGATAPDPASVFFDHNLSSLSFGGDLRIAFARDPTDAVLGRGLVQIDPVLFIGPQENGSIHLSDTTLQIIDSANTNLLMDAFLFEIAYMPSSLPGFAGMIQGHLDIPPEFAGGINNSIGSNFLAGMRAASMADEPTTFWFFADQPLFDSEGTALFGSEGVTGSLKIGVALVPEPSAMTLFGTGLLGLIWYSWRRGCGRRNVCLQAGDDQGSLTQQ